MEKSAFLSSQTGAKDTKEELWHFMALASLMKLSKTMKREFN